jgi:hypothetical protein
MAEHTPWGSPKGLARRWAAVPPALAFLAVCLGPYLARLRNPSLYADDIDRVAQLRESTLGALLFAPFNEHMAPLFQLVSWLTWGLVGRSLARAPLAFTLASYAPFLLALVVLARLLRLETSSRAAALAGVAVFSVSWLAIESVYWYSASSFMWALLATMVAWLGAAGAADPAPRRSSLPIASAAAALAPAFSAVGLLAGPIAALRASTGGGRLRSRLPAVAAPMAGMALYLTVCGAFRYHDVVAASLERQANFGPGLVAAVKAPAEALIPALFGFQPRPTRGVWSLVSLTLVAAGIAALGVRAVRSAGDRPMIAGGLALILGGYALVFCARPDVDGHPALLVQRYHLFPMLGLAVLLAPVFRRALGRWDARPVSALWVVTGLSAVLLVAHASEMRGRARFLRYPDQARTLAAIDRLGAACARLGVPRAQALAALDPIETEWTPPGRNALVLLPPGADRPALPDAAVKPALLAALSASDRRSVCGGMDATPYIRPVGATETADVAVGRRVGLFRVREAGPGRLVAAGWPAFVEFAMDACGPASDARALRLTFEGDAPAGLVEVWWRGDRGRWTETRSVRLNPRPGRAWLLPLGQLPHWAPSDAARVRLLFHAPGNLAAAAPRLVR